MSWFWPDIGIQSQPLAHMQGAQLERTKHASQVTTGEEDAATSIVALETWLCHLSVLLHD
jgi:hypothetical protein